MVFWPSVLWLGAHSFTCKSQLHVCVFFRDVLDCIQNKHITFSYNIMCLKWYGLKYYFENSTLRNTPWKFLHYTNKRDRPQHHLVKQKCLFYNWKKDSYLYVDVKCITTIAHMLCIGENIFELHHVSVNIFIQLTDRQMVST